MQSLQTGRETRVALLLAELEDSDVDEFVAFLKLKNIAASTIHGYLSRLRTLVLHADARGARRLRDLRVADLRGFVADMQSRGYKPSTVAGYVSTIKRFYGYLHAEALIDADPSRRIPRPKEPRYLPKALTVAQMRRLLDAPDESTPRGLRDKALLLVQYACALRLSELVSIRMRDLDLNDGALRVIGKGDRERRVFLKPQIVAMLRRYIEDWNINDYLFPSPSGGHLSGPHVNKIVKQYARRAELAGAVTSHTLRHSSATHYLLGGAPITFVQQLLGHASLKTTGRYTALVDEVAREIAITTRLAPDLGLNEPPHAPRRVGTSRPARELRERQWSYDEWDFEEAAWQVEKVLAWLSDCVEECDSTK